MMDRGWLVDGWMDRQQNGRQEDNRESVGGWMDSTDEGGTMCPP